jgi:hypothetical protein
MVTPLSVPALQTIELPAPIIPPVMVPAEAGALRSAPTASRYHGFAALPAIKVLLELSSEPTMSTVGDPVIFPIAAVVKLPPNVKGPVYPMPLIVPSFDQLPAK